MKILPEQMEEIAVSIAATGKQIFGFTSPYADALSAEIPLALATFMARGGKSVLLIDLQQTIGSAKGEFWTASDLRERRQVDHIEQGLDAIRVRPTEESRYSFSDSAQLSQLLHDLLTEYQLIIVSLAPILTAPRVSLNPLPMGAACDCIVLCCKLGETRRSSLFAVMEKVAAAQCRLGGIVLNDREHSTAGMEIAQFLEWLCWPLPRLRKRLQNWAKSTDLLN